MSFRALPRWLEALALAPATLLLAPFLAYGTIGLLLAIFGLGAGAGTAAGKAATIRATLLLVAQTLTGLAALACLWMLVLRGGDRIRLAPKPRWTAVALLGLGEADAIYFLFGKNPRLIGEIAAGSSSVVFWTALLVLPMLMGLRYVYLLLGPRGNE